MLKKYLTPGEAFQKVKSYCAYQERCHSEVKAKLFDFGLSVKDADEIIFKLIQENFLNEERFAILYAGGKFRLKHWGKIKIQYELRLKQISPINIKKALSQIDEDDYLKTLEKLYDSYFKKQKGIIQIKKLKTLKYLQTKGFESNLIHEVSKKLV